MTTSALKLKTREAKGTGSARALRAAGSIPGVIYGDNIPSRNIVFTQNDLRALERGGEGSNLFDVELEGEKEAVKAILYMIDRDPVTDRVRHVDLYQVRMDKELHTDIALEFSGVASAVKDLGGTLVKVIDELPVACLPGDLVRQIDVDISVLKTFDDSIRVKDLQLPKGITTRLEPESIVVNVMAPMTEEELAKLSEPTGPVDLSAIEVTGKKKEDEEAAGEGAVAGEKKEDKKPEKKKE